MLLSLFFSSGASPQLAEIVFSPSNGEVRTARRGKGLVFTDDSGSFQWTRAVKAFALLGVGTRLALASNSRFHLRGAHGSPAASLDYAVSKPTAWVADLFGGRDEGRDLRRIILRIANSEQKLPGPVDISIASPLLDPGSLRIYVGERELLTSEEILPLFQLLGGDQGAKLNQPVELEKVLSLTSEPTAPQRAASPIPWYDHPDFHELVYKDATRSLLETDVMEELAIRQALERMSTLSCFKNDETLMAAAAHLGALLPGPSERYSSTDRFSRLQELKRPIRIGCPPMAITTLILLRELATHFGIPIEIYSHHPSSSAILDLVEAGTIDFVVLSWGATQKLLAAELDEPPAPVMLLPRTSIDFLVPKSGLPAPGAEIPVYVATEAAGSPFQQFERIKQSGDRQFSNITATESSIVEIISRLTSAPACAIVSFPFSGLLTLRFDYVVNEAPIAKLPRIGDNVLFSLSSDESSSARAKEFGSAIRAAWYRLLESTEVRRDAVASLLSDSNYIKSLKRLGGLYRLSE